MLMIKTHAFGPNTQMVSAYFRALNKVTPKQWDIVEYAARIAALDSKRVLAWKTIDNALLNTALFDEPRNTAYQTAWQRAGIAAWKATQGNNIAWNAAKETTAALVVRDLITSEQFELVVKPMRAAEIKLR